MGYANRNDGRGWRAVESAAEVLADETYSAEQPAPYEDTPAGKAARRAAEIQAALTALDAASARPLRGILAAQASGGTADAADVARIADLEAQAVALRAELTALEA